MHFFFYVNENITAFEEIRKNRKKSEVKKGVSKIEYKYINSS